MKLPDRLCRLLKRLPLPGRGIGSGLGPDDRGSSLEGIEGEKPPLSRLLPPPVCGVRRGLETCPDGREEELPCLLLLSPEQLLEGDGQPRRDFVDSSLIALADSIRMHGLLHPVTVRPLPGGRGRYAVVAGERRLRAMEILGRRKVPCILVDVTPEEAAAMALVENLHRQKLSPFEEADAAAYLQESERPPLDPAELGKLLSLSCETVKDKLALRCFSERERQLLLAADLPEEALVAMTGAGSPADRVSLLKDVCRKYAEEGSAAAFVRGCLSTRQMAAKIGGAKRKLILGDIRVFYNTVDRAVEAVREAGVPALCTKEEREDRYRITVEILKAGEGEKKSAPLSAGEDGQTALPAAETDPLQKTQPGSAEDGEDLLPEAMRRRASRTVEIPSVRG